jgi:hypothetical protein
MAYSSTRKQNRHRARTSFHVDQFHSIQLKEVHDFQKREEGKVEVPRPFQTHVCLIEAVAVEAVEAVMVVVAAAASAAAVKKTTTAGDDWRRTAHVTHLAVSVGNQCPICAGSDLSVAFGPCSCRQPQTQTLDAVHADLPRNQANTCRGHFPV